MNKLLYSKNVKRLTRTDSIRIMKLLEIVQFSVIGFTLGMIIGGLINKIFPEFDEDKNKYYIFVETMIEMSVLIIVAYYIKKIAIIIPFCCDGFNNKYKSGLHNENSSGISLGLAFVFAATQTNLEKKVKYLTKQFK